MGGKLPGIFTPGGQAAQRQLHPGVGGGASCPGWEARYPEARYPRVSSPRGGGGRGKAA